MTFEMQDMALSLVLPEEFVFFKKKYFFSWRTFSLKNCDQRLLCAPISYVWPSIIVLPPSGKKCNCRTGGSYQDILVNDQNTPIKLICIHCTRFTAPGSQILRRIRRLRITAGSTGYSLHQASCVRGRSLAVASSCRSHT
jgi:hypothetical protein